MREITRPTMGRFYVVYRKGRAPEEHGSEGKYLGTDGSGAQQIHHFSFGDVRATEVEIIAPRILLTRWQVALLGGAFAAGIGAGAAVGPRLAAAVGPWIADAKGWLVVAAFVIGVVCFMLGMLWWSEAGVDDE